LEPRTEAQDFRGDVSGAELCLAGEPRLGTGANDLVQALVFFVPDLREALAAL